MDWVRERDSRKRPEIDMLLPQLLRRESSGIPRALAQLGFIPLPTMLIGFAVEFFVEEHGLRGLLFEGMQFDLHLGSLIK